MAVLHLTTDAFDQALAGGRLMMVDFWADWCGPCKLLAPVIEALGEEYQDRVIVGKVNVDEEGELALRYNVMNIPTVIFFRDGEELERRVGVMPGSEFISVLDRYLK